MTEFERGQWSAFERVLDWINEQEDQALPKTRLYEAVMAMRPHKEVKIDWYCHHEYRLDGTVVVTRVKR